MNGATLEPFLPLARLALGCGYTGKERERWVQPLAQLLEAASRGVGHLPQSECQLDADAPDAFFSLVAGNVLLPRNARFWDEVRERVESLHARRFRPLPDERVAEWLDAVLPHERNPSAHGKVKFDNRDQRKAVAALIDVPIGVLTGGPGTGKTTCVAAILALRKRMQPELEPDQVLLCAPTGKAACRLGDSIKAAAARLCLEANETEFLSNIRPQTLHRALQWGPKLPEQGGPFARGPLRPLPETLVIVDETSMVDLYLMTHLLRALGPHASLLLLGDADQLESVETGGVLAELVQRGSRSTPTVEQVQRWAARLGGSFEKPEVPMRADTASTSLPGLVVKLRYSYRAKESPWILELAAIAKPGVRSTVQQFADCCRRHEPNLMLHGSRRSLLSVCRCHWARWREVSGRWDLTHLPVGGNVGSQLRCFQLLCGDNAQVQRANRLGLAELWGGPCHFDQLGLPHGCPVLVTQNRLTLGLANGDVGIALGPGPHQAAQVVVFPNLERPVPIAQLPTHQPAFAITIHKSQGSEWQSVAIDLPSESQILDRNLLYTAISRSSGTLDIYADSDRALGSILETGPINVRARGLNRAPPIGAQLQLFDVLEPGGKRQAR